MIIVKNRQLLFSNREDYLGTPYDSGSTNRVFRLERINEDGTDLAKLDFNIDLKYMKDLSTDTAMLEKTEDDRYVYLTWNISDLPAAKEGAIKINLRGKDISGLIKWSSYQNVVYFEPTGSPITPSEEALTELEQYESSLKQLTDNLNLSETQRQEAESERVTAEQERVNAENERQQQFDEAMSEFNEDREELQGYVTSAEGSASAAAGSASAAAGSADAAEEAKEDAEAAAQQAGAMADAAVDNVTVKRNTEGKIYVDPQNLKINDPYNLTGDTPDPEGGSQTQVLLQAFANEVAKQLVSEVVKSADFQNKLKEFLVNGGGATTEGFGLDARQGNDTIDGTLAHRVKENEDAISELNSGLKTVYQREKTSFNTPSGSWTDILSLDSLEPGVYIMAISVQFNTATAISGARRFAIHRAPNGVNYGFSEAVSVGGAPQVIINRTFLLNTTSDNRPIYISLYQDSGEDIACNVLVNYIKLS